MKVTMYHSRDDWTLIGEIPSIMCLICNDQKITIKHITDLEKVVKIIKGRYHPGWDSEVIITKDGTIIKKIISI